MKKKFFAKLFGIIAAITLTFGVASCGNGSPSASPDGTTDTPPNNDSQQEELPYLDSFEYTVSYGIAAITGFKEKHAPTVLVIPDYINSFPVKAIDQDAFKDQTTIRTVIIRDGIETVGGFNGCNSLSEIKFPKQIKKIGRHAFANCSFSSFSIPQGVKTIDWYAFENCKFLNEVKIPNSVTSIGNDAFSGCSNLTSITMPNSVTTIGSYAFSRCSSLTSVTIGNGVTSIGGWAFSYCSGLTSITISNSVTFIGNLAFYGCIELTSITIPNSVTTIDSAAFYNCIGLTSVTIGNSVKTIANAVFDGCSGLKKVYYKGGKNEWDKISIDSYNSSLTNATRYYYSESKPTANGNFWHYNSKNEIEEW